MICARLWVIAAVAAMSGAASAESEAEYRSPAPQAAASAAARPAARPAMFAPAAAAAAKRLTAQQREEWRFLKDASAASRFEAEASRMASARSTNAAVRSLSATLVNHYRSTGNELEHMLHSRGMAQPMLSNDQRKTLNRLAKLSGPKFDREFVEQVGLRNQLDEVQIYERAIQSASDPLLKTWIERTLPTVRSNLAAAERMAPAASRFAKAPATSAIPAMETRSMGSSAR